MLPPVTVVIPCHDAGEDVSGAVASVLSSTHPGVRAIVVDDGSTDDATLAALDALMGLDPARLRVIRQPHRGVAAARNTGARAVESEYLAFLDADDLLARDYIEVCVRALEGHSAAVGFEVGFAYTDIILFGSTAGIWRLPEFSVYAILQQNFLPTPALMRRAVWEEAGGYNEDLRNFEDRDFWYRVLERGWPGIKVIGTVYYYRQHPRHSGVRSQIDRTPREFYRLEADIRAAHPALFTPGFLRAALASWHGTPRQWTLLRVRRWYQAIKPYFPRRILRWWRRRSLPAYLRNHPSVVAMMPDSIRMQLAPFLPQRGAIRRRVAT